MHRKVSLSLSFTRYICFKKSPPVEFHMSTRVKDCQRSPPSSLQFPPARCPVMPALPEDRCVLVQDPREPCCMQPFCDFVNPTPFPNGRPTPFPQQVPSEQPGQSTVSTTPTGLTNNGSTDREGTDTSPTIPSLPLSLSRNAFFSLYMPSCVYVSTYLCISPYMYVKKP